MTAIEETNANNHPETSASTPNSTTANQSGTKAPKDRSCPFCGQAFTSSSLGRHLDLYIKPKNPKPPDGIHDINEIRKIRGNITRRQPRTGVNGSVDHGRSSAGFPRDDSNNGTPNSMNGPKSARAQSHLAEDSPIVSPVNAKDIQEGQTLINHANWQATGVINNIPPRVPSRPHDAPSSGQARRIDEMRRDTGGNKIQRPEYESESMWRLQQDAELGRAAEMALREVLGSLEAAQRRLAPKGLFEDFDFFSLSFPGLCLAMLPPPGTLFSPTPFPSAQSWTIGVPGLRQYEAMNKILIERTAEKRKVGHVQDSMVFKHHSHMSGAWEHWQTMSDTDRMSAWNLEILRSFTRSQDQKRNLQAELEQSQQRIRHLEAEFDRLSRCQLPREYLMHPPNTLPIQPDIMQEIKPSQFTSGIGEVNYDAEALISKWKSNIKATTRPTRTSQQASTPAPNMYSENTRNTLRDDIVMTGAVWNVGGPMPRHHESHTEQHQDATPVAYETPPNPGVVVGADGDETLHTDADAEGEAVEDDVPYENFALVKRMGNNGFLNGNGKRPLAPTGSRGSAPKLYKAMEDRGQA